MTSVTVPATKAAQEKTRAVAGTYTVQDLFFSAEYPKVTFSDGHGTVDYKNGYPNQTGVSCANSATLTRKEAAALGKSLIKSVLHISLKRDEPVDVVYPVSLIRTACDKAAAKQH